MELNNNFYHILESRHSEVTGSCNILTTHFPDNSEKSIMIDYGMFQEPKYVELNFNMEHNISKLIGVVLTHNHLDHVGKVACLPQQGYDRKIYTTYETKIQMETSFSFKNSKSFYRKGLMPYCSREDIINTMEMVEACKYNKVIKIDENFSIMLLGNSHMLGAAMILVLVSYPGYVPYSFLFTGDYKEKNILFKSPRIPSWVKKLKNLIIISESTYGIEEKENSKDDTIEKIISSLNEGKIALINSIAGRFPQILYELKLAQDSGLLSTKYKICIDSKIGIKQLINHINILGNFFLPENLHFISKISRKELLEDDSPKIILASSTGTSPLYMERAVNNPKWIIYFTNHIAPESKAYNLVNSKEYTNVFWTGKYSGHGRFQEFVRLFSKFNITGLFANHGTFQNKRDFINEMSNLFDLEFAEELDNSKKYKINDSGIIQIISGIEQQKIAI